LTTARDAKGRVVFYVVHAERCDVAFSPDGTPRFYDLELSVEGGSIPPDSDVRHSPAWEGQRGTIPDHFILTAGGAVGLYVEEPANGSLYAAWTDGDNKLYTATAHRELLKAKD